MHSDSGKALASSGVPDPPDGGHDQIGAAERDRHLSLIAHELRSPLAMIRGWADVLAGADDDPDARALAIDGILSQVDRLARVADDALDLTGAALRLLRLDTRPVPLGAAVRMVLAARPATVPDIRVGAEVVVALDLQRFGQILDNLVDNADKHGDGVVRVTVDRSADHGEVVLTSRGDPIPSAQASELFDPFRRGTTEAGGMGLGLHLCKTLVQAHGGQIGVRADEDGNHFWLRLPALPATPGPA